MSLRQTTKSLAQHRHSSLHTPFSKTSYSSKHYPKEEISINDLYVDMKDKLGEMQSAFKSQNLTRERQMLKTYMKILDKIGQQVICAKQKYKGLDKQHLKIDKRLQLVAQLNNERSKCTIMAENIKQVREQIKIYEDENHFLEKQVQALQEIQNRKRELSTFQKKKYRFSKLELSKTMRKQSHHQRVQNQEQNLMILSLKQSRVLSKTHDFKKNRTKSFVLKKFCQQRSSQRNGKQLPRTNNTSIISPVQEKNQSKLI